MAIITPTNKSVLSLKGLHLYHTGFSNCAMRVRMTLEEKGLEWVSHPIDLMKDENLSAEYIGINPNAVVPTLVDDGVVIIDSADIIDYLNEKFTSGSLSPNTNSDQQQMYDWIYLARDNHLSIKTYMYSNMRGLPSRKKSAQQMDEYRNKQTFDAALVEFHERNSSEQGFSQKELHKAKTVIDDCFQKMDNRLKDNPWLAGDHFSLADIAWIPQLVILKVVGYPLENYPHLEKWKASIIERPSFKNGVLAWLPAMAK
ncbi:maleylacetoacetate isomerase [Psychromonas marina]|uniref:Maleylacetoacetate isomerase n=1 Tax=Psychromonas marina TaxID=88364 RepID=A0ABQ6E1X4_9GAMM|nr:glutathione S-transferase family protein [Psychromonas marina]GLS91185.1 maleylacetoacetate isomerase [Psychromonas marina]